jgi:2-isopropylmalate synthase
MTKKVIIYDTTLRDGMQGTGISFTLADKINIAHKLDELAVDYIEGGFPLSNDKEAEFFSRVKKEKFSHAKVVAFGSTRKPKKKAENDPNIQALIEAETKAVIVVGKTWKAHVTEVLQTTIEENLEMIYDSIVYLKKSVPEVFFDCEHFFDGYKDDPEYGLKVLRTGTEAGADTLVLCDTNGGTLPSEVTRIIGGLPLDKLNPLGVHFHDDTGTSVACSIAGIEAGAVHVQGTVNGWGERCGNANLCVLIPNLAIKLNYATSVTKHLNQLTSLSRFVSEKANIIPDKRQPYVGDGAFSHKAGQHADVISKAPHLMEHIDRSLVGNERRIILSELAGKSTIVKKLEKYGDFDKSSDVVHDLIAQLKKLEQQGFEYEAAEASFDLIIRKTLGKFVSLFKLDNYHLESYKFGDTSSKTMGKILIQLNGKTILGASVRVGPVEALDYALRDALSTAYPFISKIKLIDYKVRVLNPEDATSAKVRVFITSTDGEKSWDTVGVSEDIIEASWDALVDSIEYYYNNFVHRHSPVKE